MSHQLKYNRLKRRKRRNIVLNIVCILIAGSGLAWTANYFGDILITKLQMMRLWINILLP